VALASVVRATFDRPGGESCGSASSRPIDFGHLSRQTMGDRDLEREVLGLFVQQAVAARDVIAKSKPADRFNAVHALKGSARSVGATGIAGCLEELEKRPDDKVVVQRLARLIDEVRDLVSAIYR
jgi:HPt (histidine-containing phosphotransfer) domain-containing protein